MHPTASDVFAVLGDFAGWPTWNTQVTAMESQGVDAQGRGIWDLHMRTGVVRLVVDQQTTPSASQSGVLVTLTDNEDFVGSWTWHVQSASDGCDVQAVEDGAVRDPVMRIVAHRVMGYTATLESFVSDLAEHFGEEAELTKSVEFPDA
jgi:hypothetical protein